MRREPPVDCARQPLHVEEQVDRDDEDQDAVEERPADRDRRPLDEVDDPVGVAADVALADPLDEPVAALLDLDARQVVRVEPVLQAVDVAVGRGDVVAAVVDREVAVDPLGSGLRLGDDDRPEREYGDHERRGERDVDERDREAAADPERAEGEDERIEQERDQRRDQEEEEGVSGGLGEDPDEEDAHRQPDELDPAGDLDPRRRAGRSAHGTDRTAAPGRDPARRGVSPVRAPGARAPPG